jgi:hypothetical protein
MKTLSHLMLSTILACTSASAANATGTLNTVKAVERMLESGRTVSVAMDLGLCNPASGETKPTRTRGGLRIDAYRETEDGTLAFADDHFTIARNGKPIRQFLRYQVHADGSADFSMTIFSMPDVQQIGSTLQYKCAINHGMRFTAS